MKKSISTLLLCSLTSFLLAQTQATISGRIFEQGTNEPLPFATITLDNVLDSVMISGAISDEEGRFSISGVEKGNYVIHCSFIGYSTAAIPVLVGGKNTIFDLGKIELEALSEQLDEVIVEAKQAIVSSNLDKKAFRMADNFAQSGGSVLDAMKGLPGISVDQEGKVMLRGSDKVAVLIDGKQSSLTGFGNQSGLDNIPASNIERIEIINNPSAKYDASGMAGIINIIYKKERETGLNGEAGFSFAIGELTTRKKDLPTELGRFAPNSKYIPSLNLNYRTDKVNFFLQSEVFHRRHLPNNEFTTRTYEDGARTASQVPENRKQTQYILNGGIDWQIDPNNLLTLSSVYDYESHVDTAQVPYIDLNTRERYRYWHWREAEVTGYLNYNLNYEHKFKETGHKLNTSLQYTRGWEDEEYFLSDSSSIRQNFDTTHLDAREYTTLFMTDYVKPLRSGRLEAGAKLQFRRIPVVYIIGQGAQSIIYPGLGDESEWGENIYAGYLNYVLEKPNYDIEAGLRLEQTDVFYDLAPENIYYQQNDAYDYFKLYPNVRFTYKINDRNNLSAFYNRRVDRPGEPELRVFPKYDDPELLKVGNPYLRPQFTQTFELAYRHIWQTGSAFFSVYHRLIDDPFQRIYNIDNTNPDYSIINKIYQNVGSATNTGLEFLFSQNIRNFWELNGSFNWYENVVEAFTGNMRFPFERPFTIDQTEENTWSFKLNNQLKLPGQVQIQLTGVYYAPRNIPQGRQLSRHSVDLGIKKEILEQKGEIVFSFTDIFNGFGIRQELQGDGFTVLYENYYETQIARLGFKYKF